MLGDFRYFRDIIIYFIFLQVFYFYGLCFKICFCEFQKFDMKFKGFFCGYDGVYIVNVVEFFGNDKMNIVIG